MSSAYINTAFNNNALLTTFNPSNFAQSTSIATLNAKANQTNSNINISQSSENISTTTVSGNTLTISYSSTNDFIYISPSSTNNISLILTNLPTSSTNTSYTVTFLINTTTYKQYINTISINGTSYTPISVNGFANIGVNSSSIYVLQSFNILLINSSTPTTVLTNVLSVL